MDAYIGEIRLIGFTFVPEGYLPCDGSTRSISDYNDLFTVIGTTFGGDGQTTFGLPDLRGRVPVGAGGGLAQGTQSGTESVTLTTQQTAAHNHPLKTGQAGSSSAPGSGVVLGIAAAPQFGANDYLPAAGATTGAMASQSIGPTPSSNAVPHENRQPLLTITYVIAWSGIYPSPN